MAVTSRGVAAGCVEWMGALRRWVFAERRSEGRILAAPRGGRGASGGEQEGFAEREHRVVREVGGGSQGQGPSGQEPGEL